MYKTENQSEATITPEVEAKPSKSILGRIVLLLLALLVVAATTWGAVCLTVSNGSLEIDDWILFGGNIIGGFAGGLIAVLIYRHTLTEERHKDAQERLRVEKGQMLNVRVQAGVDMAGLLREVGDPEGPTTSRLLYIADQLGYIALDLRRGWPPQSHLERQAVMAVDRLANYYRRWANNPLDLVFSSGATEIYRRAQSLVASLKGGSSTDINASASMLYSTIDRVVESGEDPDLLS